MNILPYLLRIAGMPAPKGLASLRHKRHLERQVPITASPCLALPLAHFLKCVPRRDFEDSRIPSPTLLEPGLIEDCLIRLATREQIRTDQIDELDDHEASQR